MSEITFTERPLTLDDAQAYTDTKAAISQKMGTNRRYEVETIQSEWQEPGMDISKSSYGIFSVDGQLLAYIVLWDNFDTPVHSWLDFGVHPDYLDHNLATKLLQWADGKKDNIIERCPPDTRVSFNANTMDGYKADEQALKDAGYSKIRISYEMRIDLDKQPSPPTLPDGIIIHNYRHEELETFVTVFRDSFSDHFGYVEEPFEKDVEEFRHWFNTDSHFDPAFVFLAVDETTGEVAGYLLGFKEAHGDPTVSHIELVGVSRQYRRRGIAQALLYTAFKAFWDAGQKSVTLGVDGDSLTNAVALYERVGMYILHQYVRYEKVLRDGKELATVSVES